MKIRDKSKMTDEQKIKIAAAKMANDIIRSKDKSQIVNDANVAVFTSSNNDKLRNDAMTALEKLTDITHEKTNFAKEIATYRKYVPILLKWHAEVVKGNNVFAKQLENYETCMEEKKNKRWTPDEDDLLIEMVCNSFSMLEIATSLGRTPASINTRLSKLVGINRLSQDVVGRFIGTIDGNYVNGKINGTVMKKWKKEKEDDE